MPPMLVLLGESGSGKTTVEDRLIHKYGFIRAISHTTRPKREQDIDGVNYFFVSFDEMKRLPLVESTEYSGNIYGYTKEQCQKDRIAVVVPDGLRQLRLQPNLNIFSVYLKCPEDIRCQRMINRGDTPESAQIRLQNDRHVFNGIENMVDIVVDSSETSAMEIAETILKIYSD
jgi:guanylate kinase